MAQVEIIAANLKENINESVKASKKKVCAYARVSTDSEEQINSYESQIKHYTTYIKNNSDWEFVGVYADEGISGTQTKNRIEFQRMIDDALNGKIDIIIAKSISRFARNTMDTLKYVRLLKDKKVDVYFEKENIHTLKMDSEMFLTLYSAFAQAESESISQNVIMGFRAKMKRGEILNGSACYGYIWNKQTKELEIDEEKAEIVRMIFDWYASGIGSFTIMHKLNDMGIKSTRGGKWCSSSVKQLITNEKYVGDLRMQKTYSISPISHKHVKNFGEKPQYYVKDHHKGIITREIWDKCQELYNKRSKAMLPNGRDHKSKYSKRYAFSSKIECGLCGSNYVRRENEPRKDGTRKIYWACVSRQKKADTCKDSIFISEDNLKEMFIQIYNNIVVNKHKTRDKLFNLIKETISSNSQKDKIDKLLKEKDILEKRLSHLIDMKLDNYENKDSYEAKEKEINDRLKDIKNSLNDAKESELNNKKINNQLKVVEEILNSDKKITEFDDVAFDNLVEKIIVGEKNDDGLFNNNVVYFILKVGKEVKYEFSDRNDKAVSFRSKELEKFS